MAINKEVKEVEPDTPMEVELKALMAMSQQMDLLNSAARTRVARYLLNRFGIYIGTEY